MKAVLFGKFEFKQSRYVEDRNMQNTFYGVDVRVYSTEIVARIGTGSDFFFFNSRIVPLGFLLWENMVAFPGESQLRQGGATQPTVHAGCFSVSVIDRMGYRIFNVRTDVNACHCITGGLRTP